MPTLRGARARENVELVRKLALTSILALIAPKSAGQVRISVITNEAVQ